MTDYYSFDKPEQPHIRIDRFRQEAKHAAPSRKQSRKPLREDYEAHASRLLQQLAAALTEQSPDVTPTRINVPGLKPGRVLEVQTLPPSEKSRSLVAKVPVGLEFPAQEIIVLRTDRHDDRTESALIFVPDDSQQFLEGRILDYGRDPGSSKRPDVDRFEVVEVIKAADVLSVFSGDVDLESPDRHWWELWVRCDPPSIAAQIASMAKRARIEVHDDRLYFPDTTVLFLHATAATIAEYVARVPGAVSEVRRMTGTIEMFLDGGDASIGQSEWVSELLTRLTGAPLNAPVVCALDTGIAAGHPLIAPSLRGAWAYDEAWGSDDHHPEGGHGTPLLGLALYGDLEPLLSDTRQVTLSHGVESMKLLPPHGFRPTQPPNYGFVTQGAVSLVEIAAAGRTRCFCLAVSALDFPSSRPSSWSGALDQIAAGAMPGDSGDELPACERPKRLLLVATGNVAGGMKAEVLPSQSLEDPSQSWNALSIGGYTRKEQPPMPPPNLTPAVPANHRSPFSKGSQSLPADLTPIKPEVLFEAGNMLADEMDFCSWHPAVSLLSAGSDVGSKPLVPFWATSAAVGLAGNFIGRLQSALPNLWPETIRALMVDSARWPEPIRKNFVGTGAHWRSTLNKADFQMRLREFGYGVPDIHRAVLSARNDATLIAQAEIQPFAWGSDGRSGVFNEMHFYDLPWPKVALEDLENEVVSMKVTLSYFVEPNLTGKAATRPETYRSCGLRFEMKKRTESHSAFRNRIAVNQDDDGGGSSPEKSHWLLGPRAMKAGSLHCDLWRGQAVDLAGHDAIAVFPVGGWWKTHMGKRRVTDKTRYALTISLSAPGQSVDLYSEIAVKVAAKEIEVPIG
jgi:hypothetical protein